MKNILLKRVSTWSHKYVTFTIIAILVSFLLLVLKVSEQFGIDSGTQLFGFSFLMLYLFVMYFGVDVSIDFRKAQIRWL